MSNDAWATGSESVTVELKKALVPLPALQKAIHEFSHLAHINVLAEGVDKVLVRLETATDVRRIAYTFEARAHDLALQHQINEQTRIVREALVKAALWESLPKEP